MGKFPIAAVFSTNPISDVSNSEQVMRSSTSKGTCVTISLGPKNNFLCLDPVVHVLCHSSLGIPYSSP